MIETSYKRCAIYAFWDKDGIVDQYVYRMLENIQHIAETVIFVANGSLNTEAHRALTAMGITVLKRRNKGMDIWAYKMGMTYVGWSELSTYDEVLLINNSIMGPVYPLKGVFDAMQEKTLDFWGLTRHPETHMEQYANVNDYGYLPEHIQSFFIVFRASFIRSYEFQFYWDHLPMMNTYDDAVYHHEVVFTKYFADMGFAWDIYLHTEDIDYLTGNLMIFYPRFLIEKYKCPVFKRRIFYGDYADMIQTTTGQPALELCEYLNENKNYDTDLIWENLLRTCNMHDLFQNMHLNYTLPVKTSNRDNIRKILCKKKTALIAHIYFIDLLDDTFRYISQMPDICDMYITTNSEKTKRAIKKKISTIKCQHLEIRLIPNRGRDVSALLVGVKDIVDQYEYLCFVHDKKSAQLRGSLGESFSYKCFENTLGSEDFIYNIIETFENHPKLGLLCPPEPNHADFSPTIGFAWGPTENYKITKKLADEMDIHVPIEREKDAVAPYGSFFWFRYDALKAFYDRGWDYNDFPAEPLALDGTISHAIERLRPFVAQQAGYYTAYVMSDKFARIEYTNLRTYVENFNTAFFSNEYYGLHYDLLNKIRRSFECC